jgi:hypothetical protein
LFFFRTLLLTLGLFFFGLGLARRQLYSFMRRSLFGFGFCSATILSRLSDGCTSGFQVSLTTRFLVATTSLSQRLQRGLLFGQLSLTTLLDLQQLNLQLLTLQFGLASTRFLGSLGRSSALTLGFLFGLTQCGPLARQLFELLLLLFGSSLQLGSFATFGFRGRRQLCRIQSAATTRGNWRRLSRQRRRGGGRRRRLDGRLARKGSDSGLD